MDYSRYSWGLALFLALSSLSTAFAKPATASLEICNNSSQLAYVAVGYSLGKNRWQSQGWLLLQKGQCGTAIAADLEPGSYYYLYAANKTEDRVWEGDSGEHWFCIKPEEDFSLTFTGDTCLDSGTTKRTFWEIQVKGKSHTENLVD